jgi:hypothetical protein
MEAAVSSKMLVTIYQTTWLPILEGSSLRIVWWYSWVARTFVLVGYGFVTEKNADLVVENVDISFEKGMCKGIVNRIETVETFKGKW